MKALTDKRMEKSLHQFKRLGWVQFTLGIVSGILSLAAIGVAVNDLDQMKKENKSAEQYTIIGLDCACLASALFFAYTGLIPCSCQCGPATKTTSLSWIYLKIKYMVFSIVAASVFVPLVVGASAAVLVLHGQYNGKKVVLPAMFMTAAILEFLVAIATAVYTCYSPWKKPCKTEIEVKITDSWKGIGNGVINDGQSFETVVEQPPVYTPEAEKTAI